MTKKNIIGSEPTITDEVDALIGEREYAQPLQGKNGFVEGKLYTPSQEQVQAIKQEAKSEDKAPIQFEEKQLVEAPQGSEISTDYQYIRNNLYTITERSIEALNNLVQIADQSQHPRAYEVVALMVNSIASAQKDLMNIHHQKVKIEGLSSKNSPEVVNNNLFVGNTAQLDEIIKKMTKQSDE